MIGWSIDAQRIARLTLDRAAARNAITIAGWHDLARVAEQLSASDARAVILVSASDGAFCAGADLGELAALAEDVGNRARFREAMRTGIEAVAALPMPVIAAVDGGCYGAGVALALAADLRIAGNGAVFATTPAKLGIGYPGEDVARLVGLIGRGQAGRMLLSASAVDADEAHRIGLAELRAPHAGDAARTLARQIAELAPTAVRSLKSTIAAPLHADRDERFDAAFGSEEFAQGLAAFRSRRK